MNQKRTYKKHENAVSPVVGVMLMLVVTIIIAAVVSGVAGGLIQDVSQAPSLSANVEATTDGVTLAVNAISEPIDTSDLELIFAITNTTGAVFTDSVSDATGSGTGITAANKDFGNFVLYGGTTINVDDLSGIAGINTRIYNLTDAVTEFGTAAIWSDMAYPCDENGTQVDYSTWEPGDSTPSYWSNGTVTAQNDGTWSAYSKLGNPYGVPEVYAYYMVEFTDDWSSGSKNPWTVKYAADSLSALERGDKMTISIVHTPSGQTIFSKDVVVS
ncbi:MAG: type IV pilin N-terminal domain-containing protein [Methanocorpusculum sp.]|uniref:type IV pilin N-terminal domain-containing protein n=1 Tax=Methanocorpusculum sp. TaxID=2058474 RepID=UPI002727AB7E|nr:type IV pilin N-terminal domain-containing protein [Methanocorpusculum sp.]MDO9523039.1 type IV pilin N-terminal domain-containing protein [Methanocorpusculum sp.]